MEPLLTEQDTNLSKAIPANERLVTTLRVLATGRSLRPTVPIQDECLLKVQVIPAFCNERFYKIKVLRDDFMKITDEFMEGPEPTTTEGASGCSLARTDYLIREALTA